MSVLQRSLALLERLSVDVRGLPLATLADELSMPRSAAHRLLGELAEYGYVRQSRERGDYMLTTKLVTLGLTHLKLTGVTDLCQPIVDRLAAASGELVRLGVVDIDHLTWVITAQGATSGLRYDPDEDALELVAREGYARPGQYGPQAPTSPTAVLRALRQTRKQGYAMTVETYRPGISALAVPVTAAGRGTVGVVVISGPSVRLTETRMLELLPELQAAAAEVAGASGASPLFDRAYAPPTARAAAPAAATQALNAESTVVRARRA